MPNLEGSHLPIFLPWLRLKESCRVAGVEFWPFRDEDGKAAPIFRGAVAALAKILSSYRERDGTRMKNCVIATIADRGWSLAEEDLETVRWASALLFLASWAANEYVPRFFGPYVNSEQFRFVGQRFTGPMPNFIGLVSRRRDGSKWDGGYQHGKVNFSIPLQCSTRDAATIDKPFLAALDAANAAKSVTMERLRTALVFVQRANADDDAMTLEAEALLMASAFEQLLGGPSKAYALGRRFGQLFRRFGTATVAEARERRPGIEIDEAKPEYAEAQPKWWVHQKWLEELYDVRSKATHKGHHEDRSWGWTLREHLLMAAFVFPLTVKVLLVNEDRYTLSEDDLDRLASLDKLLAITGWDEEVEEGGPSRWNSVFSEARQDRRHARLMEKWMAENPGIWTEQPDEPTSGST